MMVYMFFFLKFKAQLRRTRPDIVRLLDESLVRAVTDAGGKITGDRFVISAVFNEETIGFWLDIFILIENLKKNIETCKDFFGFSLVISSKMPDYPEMLCRFLANHNGVFVNEQTAKNLVPYASFDKPSDWLEGIKRRKYGCGSYYKIKELKIFKRAVKNELDFDEDVNRIFTKEEGKDILIIGPSHSQMRGGLYKYCNEINGGFPPLSICFGSIGLGALVDIWSLNIRLLAGTEANTQDGTHEIDNLWEFLFRERIRDEVSDYVIRCIKRFLYYVFDYYFAAAAKKKKTPVLALENIHLAGNKITEVLTEVLADLSRENREKLVIIAVAEDDNPKELSPSSKKESKVPAKYQLWENVFKKTVIINTEKEARIFYPKLSHELWEIVYAISLFDRYFSPELFQRLFEEDDRNPIMITRAFSILNSVGIIDNLREPRPVNRHFEGYAQKILGSRCANVKELVRKRLLSWAVRRNISPCFRLLAIIANLDGVSQIDDLLLLKSINSDITNETVLGIETAMKSGLFDQLVGKKANAVRFIFNTSNALHTGNENDIENAFSGVPLEEIFAGCEAFPIIKNQILVNLSAFYLGRNNIKESAEKAKEAILLGQSRNLYCLAQGYRIFALVCLSKQQTGETIEYLSFALSNAERSGNYHELVITSYYTAASQFLYGDIYTAATHVKKSIEQSLAAGCPDWADRSRFLEGRIEFELGHYSGALDIFEALRAQPFGKKTDEKDSLLAAWVYRCKIYFQDPKTPKPESSCYDVNIFEIEAAYLAGDYKRTIDLSNSIDNPFLRDKFLYTEQADWRSGFAQCEHLYFTQGEIQKRMICLYRSLALSRLSTKGYDEAVQEIQQILRDERLCEMDPMDAFYFYAKYRILEQRSDNPVDMSTAVSMAFKRLQRRAGRIEDIETRRQYLTGPRWNSELSQTAREFKLI
jgi:tetratricopeptide (TPR) repeat protein